MSSPRIASAERTTRSTIVVAALDLTARGFAVIPLRTREKNPNRKGWERERYPAQKIPAAFASAGGLGILSGEPSGGLLDVDPDEAEAAAAWECYRPETNRRHRRASGHTHDWYTVDNPSPQTERLKDPVDGATLIELRSTGSHTCVPPSLHKETGEQAGVDCRGRARAR